MPIKSTALGGGLIGFLIGALLHPVFALFGALVGYLFGSFYGLLRGSQTRTFGAGAYARGEDTVTAQVLYKLATVDGPINEQEKYYIARMSGVQNFESDAFDAIDIDMVLRSLASNPGFSIFHRIQLVQAAANFAQCDGPMNQLEQEFLLRLAQALGLSFMGGQQQQQYYYRQQQQSYRQTASSTDYDVLGISSAAGDDEIKSAYKKLVFKYHPDRLAGQDLSDAEQDVAAKKFLAIQEAYDRIKNARGL